MSCIPGAGAQPHRAPVRLELLPKIPPPGNCGFPASGFAEAEGGCSKVNYLYLPFAEVLPGEGGVCYETFGIHCWQLQTAGFPCAKKHPRHFAGRGALSRAGRALYRRPAGTGHFMDAVLAQLP